jgi:phage/plasmid-associated DNA primase
MMTAFDNYLRQFATKNGDKNWTHTRIGDKSLKLFGGTYTIPEEKYQDFMDFYYQWVFVAGNEEYLTEKQLIIDGPILLDFDFRYDPKISTSQHTNEHIIDIVMLYANEITGLMDFTDGSMLDVYVMERKAGANQMENKTKDGIHIIINLKMNKTLQVELRNRILPKIKEICEDLPITNDWEDVLDAGVTKGDANWTLIGSQKPGFKPYEVKHHFKITYKNEDWQFNDHTASFKMKDQFFNLSARNVVCPDYPEKKNIILTSSHVQATNIRNQTVSASQSESGYSSPTQDETYTSLQAEAIELLDIIHTDAISKFIHWRKIMWAIKSEFSKEQAKELAHHYSKRTTRDNYDAEAVDNILEAKVFDCKIGTLRHYAKLSNPDKFLKIQQKYMCDYDDSHLSVAQTFIRLIDDDIIYVGEMVYIYEGRLWFCDNKNNSKLQTIFTKSLLTFYSECYKRETKKMSLLMLLENGEEKMKQQKEKTNMLLSITKQLKNDTYQDKVKKQIILYLSRPEIEFDMIKPHYFVFNNIAFDMQTKQEVILKKEDYITYSTHYDYAEPEQADVDELRKIITQILPADDVQKCYLSVLRQCCLGIKEHKFIMANGAGRNGKGLISQLMAIMLGKDYFYMGDALTLTEKQGKGPSPEVANMHKKRMILFTEPEEGSAVQLGVVKKFTGEDQTAARGLYSNNNITKLTGTIILEVNGKIKVNGKINDAALERWINIDFPNLFTAKEYLVDNITKFDVNTDYTQIEWRQKMRHCMFKILLEDKSEKIEVSKKMEKETEKYLLDNDVFLVWFNKHYVIDEKVTEPLKMIDLYETVKGDEDFWNTLTKKQKRDDYNKKGLILKLKENVKLKQYYFERKEINKINHRNVLCCVRHKTDAELHDADEEQELVEDDVAN